MDGLNGLSLESIQSQLIGQVEQAFQFLDPNEKVEYALAIEIVPDLVKSESPVICFLRTEGFDPLSAARRLAYYWKSRREIFGERWLLPMNLTGSGCLSLDDIQFLQTAYNVVFQRTPEDGLLFLIDDTRITTSNELSSTRIVFYYGTLFTDYHSQVNGATVLFVVKSGNRPNIDLNPEGWRMIRNALPMKTKQVLVARALQQGAEGQLLDNLVEQIAIAVQIKLQCFPEIIKADSLEGIARQLERKGCQKNLFPPCLGGLFDYTQFSGWFRNRLILENLKVGNVADLHNSGIVPAHQQSGQPTVATASLAPPPVPPPPIATVPTAIAQGGESGPAPAIPSLPPRRKANSAQTTTTGPPKAPSPNNEGSQHEGSQPGEPLDADAIRKRNALYSRRTYHKRKLEILSLEEQVKELRSKKEELVQESRRLESLAKRALELINEKR